MAISRTTGFYIAILLLCLPCAAQTTSPLNATPNPVNFDSTSTAKITLKAIDDQAGGTIGSLEFTFAQDEAITLGAAYSMYLVEGGVEEGSYICARDDCTYFGVDIRGRAIASLDSIVVEIGSYCGICKHGSSSGFASVFTDTLLVFSEGADPLQITLQNVIVATSIEEPPEERTYQAIDVFPNPSAGLVHIQLRSEYLASEAEVRIYNILGQQIVRRVAKPDGGYERTFYFSLENHPPGLYLARITEKSLEGRLTITHRSIVKK